LLRQAAENLDRLMLKVTTESARRIEKSNGKDFGYPQ